MKLFKYLFLIVCLSLTAFSTIKNTESTSKYKCMVQLKNYEGEGAYVILSVVDKDDNYIKTLHILGDDEKWYADITTWWSFFESKKESTNIDAITGATIAGGERSIFTFTLEESDLREGNKLRFETSVEQGEYHIKDLEVVLTPENLKAKHNGSGYVRYARIMPN